ncbi:TSUP family transporter [Jannaschia aquimarina]|uniref:Probable membrane transporter protein n=1 Tax=Jannaschia aquimarina TaxID=935700 RepID=A0A0D1EQU3_9RHOB|nr:TSUP family transporter [Jannaschia aquimarina]KIT18010.1 Sulfite exporter TauE/SafE [Jannaschia aquimarina]SNS88487.1 hypothetical protein SAMN05421775_103158 [Jannaschia aquimarina]
MTLLPELAAWLICALAVVTGAAVQRLTGAGFGMVAAPILALVAPDWLPATVLLVGVVVGVGAAAADWRAVDARDLPPGMAGRVIGAVLAAWIATNVVGTPALPMVVGLLVLLAVALSLAGFSVPIRRRTLFAAGSVAGIMGTLTGIGAPPMAILYSNVEARRSAATQNVFFGFGMVVSIGALAFAGLVGLRHLAFAATLIPLVPLTFHLVRPFAARLHAGSIRPWALGLATVASLVLIGRSLAG